VAVAAPIPIKLVRAEADVEIPRACQDALSQTEGDFLVLLNNDAIVTEGWLDHLVALANLAPKIGMVGPMSNIAAPPQWVETVPYRICRNPSTSPSACTPRENILVDIEAVNSFGKEWRERNRGKWMEVDRLGGFCLLIKRQVLETTGPLQNKSGLSIFDTDSLCLKARQAGFNLACCMDVFVHHFGTRVSSVKEQPGNG
jgi:GT2 family glycosyltransferase